jgi:hypothetical protein
VRLDSGGGDAAAAGTSGAAGTTAGTGGLSGSGGSGGSSGAAGTSPGTAGSAGAPASGGQGGATLALSPAAGVFGNVPTGSSKDVLFTLSNSGPAAASGIAATITGSSGFSLPAPTGNECGSTLAGNNATCSIRVRFTPPGLVGPVTGTLTVGTTTGSGPSPVSVSANAYGILAVPAAPDTQLAKLGGINGAGTAIVGTLQSSDFSGAVGFYRTIGSAAVTVIPPVWPYRGQPIFPLERHFNWDHLDDLWEQDSTTGHYPAGNATVGGISGDGTVIVGTNANNVAIEWSTPFTSPPEMLPALPNATQSSALGVNQDGSVIVGVAVVGSNSLAVAWTPGAVDITSALSGVPNIGSFSLGQPTAVSADGKLIAGDGTFNGVMVPWVARLP